LPRGILKLVAGAAGALGALQQSQTAASPATPLLNQHAVRSLLLTSSLSSRLLVSLCQSRVWGAHSVCKTLTVCKHRSVQELRAPRLNGTRALSRIIDTPLTFNRPSVFGDNLHTAMQRCQACRPRITAGSHAASSPRGTALRCVTAAQSGSSPWLAVFSAKQSGWSSPPHPVSSNLCGLGLLQQLCRQ
jgi:hypothetical protein